MLTHAHNYSCSTSREVVLGKYDVDDDQEGITRKISEKNIIIHEQYKVEQRGLQSGFQVNDIALIHLNEPVELFSESPTTSNVIPICLPWSENDFTRDWKGYKSDNEIAHVTGWGRVPGRLFGHIQRRCEFGVGATDGVLRVAKVEVTNNRCETEFPQDFDSKKRICVGGGEGKFNV